MNETAIQDLLQKIALQDDQQAFRALYFHYYSKLYNLACFYLKSAEATEEVVNDTFVAIWSRRAQVTAINDFTSYLYKTVKNKSLNSLKLRSSTVHLQIDELTTDLEDITLNMEDQLIVSDFQHLIETAVNKLPDQCRLVFKMIREDNLSHREVAELLNISVRTIEYHMSIALKKLAESLNYSRYGSQLSSK